ncbi:MAG: ABC transporter permease [Actinobacteria bacterium]|nr:ABC transporter permease [Actinomycetota bacterium]
METDVKIYRPHLKEGLNIALPLMVRSLINSRELILRLITRDIKAKYKQSLFGWLWVFITPFMTMVAFLLLNVSGIIVIGSIPVPYPIFGLLGIIFWYTLGSGWVALTNSLTSAGTLIGKINFPREVLVFSAIGQMVIDLFVQFILVILIYFFYGLFPSIWLFLIPVFIIPLILLSLGLGFITSLLNVVVRDTVNFVSIFMNFVLFLMPIMYVIPKAGILSLLNRYNPVFYLINCPRNLIISGNFQDAESYLLSILFSVVIFLMGWYVFYMSESKLAERI